MSDSTPNEVTLDAEGNLLPHSEVVPAEQPKQIGRYRIEKVLGKGGFGLVYLAHDEQLDRQVAIKVPHAKLISKPDDAEAYLAEARTVASLDHPHIVPVFDVGSSNECPCYVVSKYIEGLNLSQKIKESRLKYRDAAELVATVAEALHYAHKQGLVHRDVKPGNILIGKDGQPYVVDFGLALREEDVGKGPRYAGTPAYMSPEQARGEGHRVDGRSDIFSLGVVFYELLAGRKPFRGDTRAELFEQVTSYEAKPLRQYDEKLPRELERICHKALSKRASERYSSAHDMAEDLHLYLQEQTEIGAGTTPGGVISGSSTVHPQMPQAAASVSSVAGSSPSLEAGSESQPIKVVPKGLRSFDAHDADFFLELLPGPRDREGLPDSLRFWKARIEEPDPDNTFHVGLIYGPSGCGKSSLVKAGLLPRLSEDVIPVYIEATPEETETRLLNGLRKRCLAFEDNLNLKDTLAALRRGQGIPVGKKVLIVLDQFEQWLHARKEEEGTDLVQALRQCDGGRVQCVVMVRDDFWMAATRFMRELEIRLIEGHNSAAVDLFPIRHAERVLSAFGRAFGTLPENISETTKEQKDFLKQSVLGLAEEGKVVCVRLALFAEMMKGKEWTPASLKDVGGTKGVGVAFLEETFSASTSPPEHRYHQKAARAVLNDLLPSAGTDIKGTMQSHADLLEASGYGNRPKDFDDLIRILDSEIRLITPTDPEGKDANDVTTPNTVSGHKYFQLTHDYLVHSLRDWLTRKQKETRRGRAELKLFDTSATWNAKPENRFLPTWWEHVAIRLLTDREKWTEPQRKMMAQAMRVHGSHMVIALAVVVAVLLGGISIRNVVNERQRDAEATRIVEGLLQADTSQVESIIEDLADYHKHASDDLETAFTESPDDSNAKLHAALALQTENNAVLQFLKERLLTVSPQQFQYVRDLFPLNRDETVSDYWEIATDNGLPQSRRFQAACALASFDSNNEHWQDENLTQFVTNHLVGVYPSELAPWRDALRPVQAQLDAPLAVIYRDNARDEQARGFATETLVDFLSNDADGLFALLIDANESQFAPVFDKLSLHRDRAIVLGNAEVIRTIPSEATEYDKEHEAIRKANAAIMLMRMGASENVWSLLKWSPDPRVRSYIIHWLPQRGGDFRLIAERFTLETDVTIKRALLLCLGEFELPDSERQVVLENLLMVYRSDPDAGMHSAAEWLLRQWKQQEKISAIDAELRQVEDDFSSTEDSRRQWCVNGRGQTFAILNADEFQMSSPETEVGRGPNETLHQRKINRRFAISTKEITREQWRAFSSDNPKLVWSADEKRLADYFQSNDLALDDDSPMTGMTWFEAAWYCNWLSEQEGIPASQWCYETNESNMYGPGMKSKENILELTGYRLPTEAEWEYACRAGASSSRFYGTSEALLTRYAWYLANGEARVHPVASVKPNDFGMFDIHGNASEWCHQSVLVDPSSAEEPASDPANAIADDHLGGPILRGGSFLDHPSVIRSAARRRMERYYRLYSNGLRPVRTLHQLP